MEGDERQEGCVSVHSQRDGRHHKGGCTHHCCQRIGVGRQAAVQHHNKTCASSSCRVRAWAPPGAWSNKARCYQIQNPTKALCSSTTEPDKQQLQDQSLGTPRHMAEQSTLLPSTEILQHCQGAVQQHHRAWQAASLNQSLCMGCC